MAVETLLATGELAEGVCVDGVWHRTFTLRPPTVADNIAAVDEVGTTNAVALSVAILAQQLVQLGSLQPKQITYTLIAGLHPTDFNLLEQEAAALEKKRQAALAAARNGSASALPSAGQA